MSCKELIESLRKAADERTRLLWQEAEQETRLQDRAELLAARAAAAGAWTRKRTAVSDRDQFSGRRSVSPQPGADHSGCAPRRSCPSGYTRRPVSCLPALRKRGVRRHCSGRWQRSCRPLPGRAVRVNSGDAGYRTGSISRERRSSPTQYHRRHGCFGRRERLDQGDQYVRKEAGAGMGRHCSPT